MHERAILVRFPVLFFSCRQGEKKDKFTVLVFRAGRDGFPVLFFSCPQGEKKDSPSLDRAASVSNWYTGSGDQAGWIHFHLRVSGRRVCRNELEMQVCTGEEGREQEPVSGSN